MALINPLFYLNLFWRSFETISGNSMVAMDDWAIRSAAQSIGGGSTTFLKRWHCALQDPKQIRS